MRHMKITNSISCIASMEQRGDGRAAKGRHHDVTPRQGKEETQPRVLKRNCIKYNRMRLTPCRYWNLSSVIVWLSWAEKKIHHPSCAAKLHSQSGGNASVKVFFFKKIAGFRSPPDGTQVQQGSTCVIIFFPILAQNCSLFSNLSRCTLGLKCLSYLK